MNFRTCVSSLFCLLSVFFSACLQEKLPLEPRQILQKIKILQPLDRQIIEFGDPIEIEVMGDDANINRLQLFVNNRLLFESTTGYIQLQFDRGIHYRPGSMQIKVLAISNDMEIGVNSVTISIVSETIPVYTPDILHIFNHDSLSFTQGLVYENGYFYESGGLYGQSSLRKTIVETGEVVQIQYLSNNYFAEGLALWQNQLIQLTWREKTGFVYDKSTFDTLQTFSYNTEGWGLTTDETRLIMSDGTSVLFFLHPQSYNLLFSRAVTAEDMPVTNLNELEYIQGDLFANIWRATYIARIDITNGQVIAWLDLDSLSGLNTRGVLNGVAYDPQTDYLFITGKQWSSVYQIDLLPQKNVMLKGREAYVQN
jgi:glutamine cyclotransferase